MKFSKYLWLVSRLNLSLLLTSLSAFGSHQPDATVVVDSSSFAAESNTSVPRRVFASLFTSFQFRSLSGSAEAWNQLRLGYRFTNNFSLGYNQGLLYDLRRTGIEGSNLRWDDGLIRVRWEEAFRVGRVPVTLDQNYFLPTSRISRLQKTIGGFRNRFTAHFNVSRTFGFEIEESPTLFWHQANGAVIGGEPWANEAFRNAIILTPTFRRGRFAFYMAVYFQTSRYRDYPLDRWNGGAWRHRVFLWPELTYRLSDHVELGVAVQTDSLVANDFSSLTVERAFKNVTSSLELNLTL